ncbi:hypothetical protein F5876DRAFT_82087 [Lentinula aff. lateritia]|uniref:Uncharacterized protein n=1 Tax=Lentinula aff. lateritia TaxID=2804960 RepID=A0ACC1TKE4_9AGAR|nr:hypothetical protein F5876DRAFT_82087 [Lentinula aff. lateritia]
MSSLQSSKRSNTRFYHTSKQSERVFELPQPILKLPKRLLFWDLDLANVEAIPYVELHITSPLLPPMLEDVRLYLHFPGPPSRAYTRSGALTPGTHYIYDLSRSCIVNPIYFKSYDVTIRRSPAPSNL